MKMKELKQKNKNELRKLLTENQKKIGQFRFDLNSKKIKNVKEMKELKKDAARILTILNKEDHD
ncbi:MAG: 50S ribosomal protein L29 [Candidatus Portnoybacteria bacterium CG_4_8_14_3_um_filter_44_15]|uniref:Large ribosomal subunit protein uL29 n=4 Tax=Candidatus Portnoyibacteriota TaxID=1817913 RepID=A0A2M7YLK6_9BACT|nr:MAG: 50S ribosomal protein L29 [Parcubacteria group bacterium CG1_02_44_65]PIP15818.1 MAG: 50S ribosomal protein L29 [Candidatus Portnoybacteria bacterium CG23_combo_of_CG06-09_8_20_14_all_44_36]PIW74725.1 MAG: 50S ribosomal protein L29 [Candidatus Portnoybacteria bacterium CG_4_8_14_3_um_filter_44_15]PIZ69223.1 MAG: 50S ribosomal protein L29 [Candidatus Portnoybacteria bacterium CG_4_10_14_0_2_um_filter_43_36]PJA63850.1 MAG: 50S ribosomal protein L29 [Candidatus Portnoybacteria bacterium CG